MGMENMWKKLLVVSHFNDELKFLDDKCLGFYFFLSQLPLLYLALKVYILVIDIKLIHF